MAILPHRGWLWSRLWSKIRIGIEVLDDTRYDARLKLGVTTMATGYELVPLMYGGLTMRVRDIPTADASLRFPLIRAGVTGLTCSATQILNTMADTERLPLVSGGASVSVAEIKTFD